jgi:protein subunit release factor A
LQNEKIAWDELNKRLNDLSVRDNNHKLANNKREQLGIAGRSNKIRTYNQKTGTVINHINNKKITFRDLYKGDLEKIH